jgi:hypothetical protein
VVVAAEHGPEAVGSFYAALGRRTFEEAPPPEDQRATIAESLGEVGLDPQLRDRALADPATWDAVVQSTLRVVERIGKLGVPTIALDDEDGPMIFGPVVSEPPSDAGAVELWRHTAWLLRDDNFWELKRGNRRLPDLPAIRSRMEQRAAREAATATSGGT